MNGIGTERDLERLARRRVGMKLGWYVHALVYALVNAGLYATDSTSGGHRWSTWPLAGWGLGLAIHGIVAWLALHDGWRRRMVADEVAALRRRQRPRQ